MEDDMRDDYDFSGGIRNPFAKKLKKQITINVSEEVIEYFKNMQTKSTDQCFI